MQKLAPFLTSSNVNQFSKLFYCPNQLKFGIPLSLKILSHLKCVATLPCVLQKAPRRGGRLVDRAICQWRRRLECVVALQQSKHAEHLM